MRCCQNNAAIATLNHTVTLILKRIKLKICCYKKLSIKQDVILLPMYEITTLCHVLGSYQEEFQQYFLGGGVQLQDPELVYSGCNRYQLHTQAMGTVHLEISIVLRNFEKFGIES